MRTLLVLLVVVVLASACGSGTDPVATPDAASTAADAGPLEEASAGDLGGRPVASADDRTVVNSSGGVVGPSSAPAPIAPIGEDYELLTSEGFVQLRPGESRQVTVSVNSVGLNGGVWGLSTSQLGLHNGVFEATGPASSLDLSVDREATFTVELSATVDAVVGFAGTYEVLFDPPADDAGSSGRNSATINAEVVAATDAVGPAAASDWVAFVPDGVVFDPTLNDSAGDAALAPGSLSIVAAPTSGTLTVTGPGELTYTPGQIGEDSAVYQICDTNNLCANAQIRLWADPDA